MKKMKFYMVTLMAFIMLSLAACHSENPVDKYVELTNEIKDQISNCQNISEIQSLMYSTTGDKAIELLQENGDYKLTQSDKEKLIKANKELMMAAFDKTSQLATLPQEMKEAAKSALDEQIQVISQHIENSETLKDLGMFN